MLIRLTAELASQPPPPRADCAKLIQNDRYRAPTVALLQIEHKGFELNRFKSGWHRTPEDQLRSNR
jgi:hypothetical protein